MCKHFPLQGGNVSQKGENLLSGTNEFKEFYPE